MAFVLSAVLGAILSVGYATKIFHAIVEGVITTHPRHGTPRVYYWFEDRSGFIWAIFDLAITAFGSWAIIAGALFKAAQWSSNQEAAKPPTPPTRTAPQ